MAKQTQSAAQPAVTLTPEALQQVIAQAVAEATDRRNKDQRSNDLETLTVRAFKRAGYSDIKPRENVMTYNRWIAAGRKVKAGEKAVRVRNLRLFFITQTEPLSQKEQAEEMAKCEAKSSASKLPAVSPISAAAKGKSAAPRPAA
jgi:hypothetical protein